MMTDANIGERIRDARTRAGLSQDGFAALMREDTPGIRTNCMTLSRYECGKQNPAGVYRLAIERVIAKLADTGG